MNTLNHYKPLADLFRYPDENFLLRANSFLRTVSAAFPAQAEKLSAFISAIEGLTVKQQQEYFMKTFDVQAICYLDIGYVMFGEDYKRAQLLVNLQNEHKTADVDCGTELADHLPNVLSLLASSDNQEFTEELGFIILTPAVRFMLTKFTNTQNCYKGLLEVLLAILQHDFPGGGLAEYAFAEESFSGTNEFLMPSPKMDICDSNCKQKRH
jgi:nitrate reductase assembly molybdenum cofactor insertion protein NarJ